MNNKLSNAPLVNSGRIRLNKSYVEDTVILMWSSDIGYSYVLLCLTLSILTYNLPLMNSATIKSISLTSTSILLEVLFIESPLILVNTSTFHASFTLLSRNISWIRALVNRSYKICSSVTLLNNELNKSKISFLGIVSLAN